MLSLTVEQAAVLSSFRIREGVKGKQKHSLKNSCSVSNVNVEQVFIKDQL